MDQQQQIVLSNDAISTFSLGIPIGFILIASILLWFMIGAKGWWVWKAIAIGLTLYFGVAVWHSVNSYLGWPSHDPLPPKYMVSWVVIQEPDQKTSHPGAFYLWVKEIESTDKDPFLNSMAYRANSFEPRVYRLPYDPQLHKQMQQMLNQMKKGQVFIGGANAGKGGDGKGGKGKGKGKGGKGEGPKGHGKGEGFGFSHQSRDIYLYPLPPPLIPEKISGDSN